MLLLFYTQSLKTWPARCVPVALVSQCWTAVNVSLQLNRAAAAHVQRFLLWLLWNTPVLQRVWSDGKLILASCVYLSCSAQFRHSFVTVLVWDTISMAVYRITFKTAGWNRLTAEMVQRAIARKLNSCCIEYSTISRLPFEIELTEQQYLMFCLQWTETVWDYSVRKGSAG